MSKDLPTRAFFPGYVVPAALGLLVAANLLAGRVYWPARGGSWTVRTDGWSVYGTILAKLGIAVGCYAWYALANDDRREHLATPILAASVVVAIAGLALVVVGGLG